MFTKITHSDQDDRFQHDNQAGSEYANRYDGDHDRFDQMDQFDNADQSGENNDFEMVDSNGFDRNQDENERHDQFGRGNKWKKAILFPIW